MADSGADIPNQRTIIKSIVPYKLFNVSQTGRQVFEERANQKERPLMNQPTGERD